MELLSNETLQLLVQYVLIHAFRFPMESSTLSSCAFWETQSGSMARRAVWTSPLVPTFS